MVNVQIAKLFREIADFLEMDAVAFKPAAYRRAAWGVESSGGDVKELYQKGGLAALEEIPGVGKDLALKMEEFMKTGKVKALEELRKKTPVDVAGLTRIEGIGAKTVKKLYEGLKIATIEDLEKAAKAGKVRTLEGFDAKKEQNFLHGIAFLKQEHGRMLLSEASAMAFSLKEALEKRSEVKRVEVVGSLRRMRETIGDIDLLAISRDPEKTAEAFASFESVKHVYGKGESKVNVRFQNGVDGDLRVFAPEEFGAAMQYFTGSKEHNVALRILAQKKRLKLNEYGLFKEAKNSKLKTQNHKSRLKAGWIQIGGKTEEEIYRLLGMDYIEPEMREDMGEIEAALKGKLPKLISYDSLKGDLQTQTNASDGEHSIAQMAEAAFDAGLSYIGITDHSRSLKIAGGLDRDRLEKQMKEIDALNKKSKGEFRILKSAEIDILEDGSLDMPGDLLAELDYALVTVHTHFKMSSKEMTARIIKALSNPLVDILGHPTGRLVMKRPPYEVDMAEVIKAANSYGVALEINAFPERLDLNDIHIRQAREAGAKFVISSDAHNKSHFSVLRFGIAQARRGWIKADDVLNTLSCEKFLKAVSRHQSRSMKHGA